MFGWRITRVDGGSMAPKLADGDYVISRKTAASLGDVVLVRHSLFGLIVKRILRTDSSGRYIVGGDNSLSTPEDLIGPVTPDIIAGVVRWRLSPSGLFRLSNQRSSGRPYWR